MALALHEIEDQALKLSIKEREALAGRLLHSVANGVLTEADEAWIEVAEQRYQDHRAGTTPAVPGTHVFSDLRRKLGWPG